MEYNRIVAVTGMPGLYEIINSKSDGAIVRSLEDGNTKFVSSRIHNLSHLESIEVYTTDENVNLVEIFQAMKANNTALPDVKDNKSLNTYFQKVFPSIDTERVYSSDMKKMVKWFETLEKNKIEYKLTEQEPEEEEAAPVAEEKPAAKATAAKEEKPKAPKAKAAAPAEKEETPKPKAAAKEKKETAAAPKARAATKEKADKPAKTEAAKKKKS